MPCCIHQMQNFQSLTKSRFGRMLRKCHVRLRSNNLALSPETDVHSLPRVLVPLPGSNGSPGACELQGLSLRSSKQHSFNSKASETSQTPRTGKRRKPGTWALCNTVWQWNKWTIATSRWCLPLRRQCWAIENKLQRSTYGAIPFK